MINDPESINELLGNVNKLDNETIKEAIKEVENEDMKEELKQLRIENHNMKEQLENFIPRRRVRRIYKMLGNILEADTDVKPYIDILTRFINEIEKKGKAEAGQEVKMAIEHLLSVRER